MSLSLFKRKKYLELIDRQIRAENADADDEANVDVEDSPEEEEEYEEDYDEEYD